MKKALDYIKTHKYCLLVLYWPFHTLWYEVLRLLYSGKDVLLIECELDRMIPFCEWFIIPYCLWYFYIASVLIYSLIKSRREFLRASFLMIGCMFIPMLFCTLVPNGIPLSLRPDFDALGRDNLLISGVKLIYASDSPPRNVMPSMHVSVSFAMLFSVLKSESLKHKKAVKLCAVVLSVLISVSTVFIKQHSVLDVLFGVLVSLVVFAPYLLFERRFDNRKRLSVNRR